MKFTSVLFEVNRISNRGDIPKKLCASYHASTHISEKSCFRSRQKLRKCAGAILSSPWSENKMCIIRQPVKLSQKTTLQWNLHKKRHYSVISSGISSVIFLSILCLWKCDGEKGWVSNFYYNFRLDFLLRRN